MVEESWIRKAVPPPTIFFFWFFSFDWYKKYTVGSSGLRFLSVQEYMYTCSNYHAWMYRSMYDDLYRMYYVSQYQTPASGQITVKQVTGYSLIRMR